MKKVLIAMTVLAAFGLATVTDGVNGLGLGGNPVAPALWKSEKRIDAGLTVKNDRTDYIEGETIVRSPEVVNAPWVTWTDAIDSTTFYQVGLFNSSYTSQSKATHSVNKLTGGITKTLGNISLGANLGYEMSSVQQPKANSKAPANKPVEYNALTISLGAALALDSKQSVLAGYSTGFDYTKVQAKNKKLGETKNKETDISQGTDIALGYVYTVSDALQLGAQVISSWTPDNDPTKTFGLAASYLPISQVELQGYLNLTNDVYANSEDDVAGYNKTNGGLNATWTPAFANIGSIGAGIDVSSYTHNEEDLGIVETVGTLFYTYLF
jgi:hypothetical protein